MNWPLAFIGEQPGCQRRCGGAGRPGPHPGRLLRDRGGRRHPLSPPSTADRARFGHSDSREQSSARPTPSGRDHPSVHRPRTGVFTPVRRSPPASHDPQPAHALLCELARSRRRSFDSEPKSATATQRCRLGPSTAQAQPRGQHRARSAPALGAELAVVVHGRERKSKSRRLVTLFSRSTFFLNEHEKGFHSQSFLRFSGLACYARRWALQHGRTYP